MIPIRRKLWHGVTVLVTAMLTAFMAAGSMPQTAQAFTTLCAAGSFQGWTPSTGPQLVDDGTGADVASGDGIYTVETSIPTIGVHEMKIVADCDDSFTTTWPTDNFVFETDTPGQNVTITFQPNAIGDGWLPDTNRVGVTGDSTDGPFTAVGDWQSEGGAAGDWENADPQTTLIYDEGSGYHIGRYTLDASGSYIGKIMYQGRWAGYNDDAGGGNASFNGTAGQQLTFTLDVANDRFKVEDVPNLSWCAAGDFNGFDENTHPLYDDGTNGDVTADDGVFSLDHTEAVAGTYNFKIVECGNWGNAHPALANSFYTTSAANQVVRFEFTADTIGDGYFPATNVVNTVGDTEPTGPFVGVGNWQGEAGGADWDNASAVTQLTDDGGGLYSGSFSIDTAGNYIGRITFSGSWDRYDKQGLHRDQDSADFEFGIASANDSVMINLDVNQGRAMFTGTGAAEVTYCAAGEWQGSSWNPGVDQMVDDGTGGDAVAGDGIYTHQITVATPGEYGWKVAEGCQWGVEYPGGFGVDSYYVTTTNNETVNLIFDTRDFSADAFSPDTNIVHAEDSITDAVSADGYAITGTFQDDLGGTIGDTNDSIFWLVDDGTGDDAAAGDGIYTLTLTIPTVGGYSAEFATAGASGFTFPINENTGRVRGSLPLLVITGTANQDVTFYYDSNTSRGYFDTVATGGIDDDINFDDMFHDSRDPFYRSPGGPIDIDGVNDDVTLRLQTAAGDAQVVLLRYYNDRTDTNTITAMNFDSTDGTYDYYEYTIPGVSDPTAIFYWFLAVDGVAEAYYQDDVDPGGVMVGGPGEATADNFDRSWQISYYDPAFTTPDWVQNAVIYQIFPERFRDGDPGNNPTSGEFFYDEPYGTIVRSADPEDDWMTPVCDPRENVGTSCENSYSRNFYGGDLQGITEMIESGYFTDLGVTALYLNPIFESPSNHKYDTFDFLEVDDNFGGMTAYQDMIAAADDAGLYIILDGVFNHASSDSVYFDRYSRWDANGDPTTMGVDDNSGACEDPVGTGPSPWFDWFNFFAVDPGTGPCGDADDYDYPYWFGIFDSLAVFDSTFPDVQDYFYGNGLAAVGPYWIDQGADGWRLDVAPEIDHGVQVDPNNLYWEEFRDAVHAVNPDTYIVGEEWGIATSWTIGGDNGTGPVGEWDATMNYQFGAATMSFWRDTTLTDNDFNTGSSARVLAPLTPSEWNARMLGLMERYPPEAFAAMMNLFGSHDTNRVLFLLNEDPNLMADPQTAEDAMENADYGYWLDAVERYKGAALIQFSMPGAPTHYYGNEIGLVGPVGHDGSQWQDDPYNRQPYPWADESGTPWYDHLDPNHPDYVGDYLSAYLALLADARNEHSFLRTGEYIPLEMDDANMVLAYARQDNTGEGYTVINRGTTTQNITLDVDATLSVADGTTYYDVLTNTTYTVSGGEIAITLDAGDYAMLVPPTAPDKLIAGLAATSEAPVPDNAITLTWDDRASNEDGYIIERSLNGISGWTQVGMAERNATSFTDEGLTCGVRYWYRVSAYNGNEVTTGTIMDSDVACNLLDDAGAELDPSEWNSVGSGSSYATPMAKYGETVFLRNATGGATTAILQTVDTSGAMGDDLTLTAYVAGQSLSSDGQIGMRVELLDGGSVVQTENCLVTARGSFGWQPVTCTITAGTSFDSVRVTAGARNVTSGFVGFDGLVLLD